MSTTTTGDQAGLEAQAQDDRCWDGNWLMDGLNGWFMSLDDTDFLENQLEDFQEDQEEAGGTLKMEHEFLYLDTVIGEPLEENWAELQRKILQPRKLHLADGLVRRVVENSCPPRIRIRRIAKEQWNHVLEQKQKGNKAFGENKYQEAIDHYEEAFIYVEDDMFVAPKEQMEQIVNILSNQAECYLRLKKFQDAGNAATCALLIDNSHEKSRMRRTKAELAIAGVPYLIQAQVDLEELINEGYTKAGVKQAREYLGQVKELLEMEKKIFLRENANADWDLYVRMLRSKCW